MSLAAEIGIFGGSGFYEWLDAADEVEIETPYGPPSGSIGAPPAIGSATACASASGSLPPSWEPGFGAWFFSKSS